MSTAAATALRTVARGECPVLLRSTLIHVHLLSAALSRQRAIEAHAHESLLAALRLAGETEILRPFMTVGPVVHRQLIAAADRSGHLATVTHRVVDLIDPGLATHQPLALLTPTEASLLRDRPSLLAIRDIAVARSVKGGRDPREPGRIG